MAAFAVVAPGLRDVHRVSNVSLRRENIEPWTNPIETGLAGKTPRQKRTTVPTVNGRYSLMDGGPKASTARGNAC